MTKIALRTVYTVADLRIAIAEHKKAGKRIALVPTMGNLHEGHTSLIDTARKHADIVVASVFVNPTQFSPDEDFSSYPRTLDSDATKLMNASVNILFAPTTRDMYPTGFSTNVTVDGITDCLCGLNRPHHFQGVSTVVTKLLLQCQPDVAVFGKKDYQQLQVIRHMVRDLDIPVEIIGSQTWREEDGLAMSSRNGYLDDTQRAIAPILYKVISEIAWHANDGKPLGPLLDEGKKTILKAGLDSVDYLEVRDAESLVPLHQIENTKARVFVAAHIGATRLIDNVSVSNKRPN